MTIDIPRRLLLVEDDPGLRAQMRWALADFEVAIAGDRVQALTAFRSVPGGYPVVVLDLGLPPDDSGASEGLACLAEILAERPGTKVIVASGNAERANAVRAVAAGAYDFYCKPVDVEVLSLMLDRAWRLSELEAENRALAAHRVGAMGGLVTGAPSMQKVCQKLERVAATDVGILILGESGTGKELLARAAHDYSPRASGPFIAINCASIPESLLESELFGHEKGAFTGAIKRTLGKVELAHHGTLFLDEIGDLPMSLQAKLLRFLQERCFERVGGRERITVDVRLVSATHQRLDEMIGSGRFREDLYYRLNEVRLDVPPLRERPGDALLLATHFLHRFNAEYRRNLKGFGSDAVDAIGRHPWPGNVRELANRVKRAVIMADGRVITASDLDLADLRDTEVGDGDTTLRNARERLERQLVQEAIARAQGNMSRAARALGVSRPTLYHLIKSLDVPLDREIGRDVGSVS